MEDGKTRKILEDGKTWKMAEDTVEGFGPGVARDGATEGDGIFTTENTERTEVRAESQENRWRTRAKADRSFRVIRAIRGPSLLGGLSAFAEWFSL
jgi:hypothetical protein